MDVIKNGAIVTITKSDNNWGDYMSRYVGQTYKLIDSTTNSARKFQNYDPGMDRYGWQEYNGHYRLATCAEQCKYYSGLTKPPSVGQSVILKEDDNWNSTMVDKFKNKVAIVEYVNGNFFHVKGDGNSWDFRGWEPNDSTQKCDLAATSLVGSTRTIAGKAGTIEIHNNQYYWRPDDGDMEAIYRKKGLDMEKFADYVLGHSNTYEGDLILCRSSAELHTFLITLDSYRRGNMSSIELPSYGGCYVGDEIQFAGDGCPIEEDSSGTHPFYISNVDCDEVFEKVEEVTGLDRYEHQYTILGYKDPREYDFPQAASIRDLLRYIDTLRDILTQHERGERKVIPEEEDFFEPDPLRNGQDYTLLRYQGSIISSYGSWFWAYSAGNNDICFVEKGLDKESFQRQVLGYSNNGSFPHCKSASDLKIFLEAISNYPSAHPSQQKETPLEALHKAEGAVNTPQIIFINVPKI